MYDSYITHTGSVRSCSQLSSWLTWSQVQLWTMSRASQSHVCQNLMPKEWHSGGIKYIQGPVLTLRVAIWSLGAPTVVVRDTYACLTTTRDHPINQVNTAEIKADALHNFFLRLLSLFVVLAVQVMYTFVIPQTYSQTRACRTKRNRERDSFHTCVWYNCSH